MNKLDELVDCCSELGLDEIYEEVRASGRFPEDQSKEVAAYLFYLSHS